LVVASAFTSCGPPPTKIERTDRTILLVLDPHAPERPIGNAIAAACVELTLPDSAVVEVVEDYTLLQEDSIQQFSAVILAELTIDSLPIHHRTSLQRYVQAGGGLLLADTAAVPPYTWDWLSRLRTDTLSAAEALPSLAHLETGYRGEGRVGRLRATEDPAAVDWGSALGTVLPFLVGENRYDYGLVTAPLAPEWSRFSRHVLDDDIVEPMEMEILPSGEILFLERRGRMKLHDPFRGETRVVTDWPVCTEGNYEDGLHGVALDPGYGRDNHWIYVYYSPMPCDTNYQYLSRFDFRDGELNWDSEKLLLRVFVQRETCCHSGGSVEFGPDSLLYLSTGDNTSSKESDGYTPTDERPGRGPFDAQKSSGNTHDLRGKILRIRPEPDGTYSIPEGNLFPPDGSQGRPEIYAMGCRNPFRITIDPRTNFLYWGDVGPDVGQPGRYGPQSYDEFNRAKAPGNFGWPYFVADNQAYPDRNFATDEVGPPQNPAAPVNDSPNNYGSRELPPAQVPLFWYPYGESAEFPPLGVGSRSAMAGPFYYRDDQWPLTQVSFPEYYEGKWFIYEWARSWIKVVTFDDNQQPVQIEDFWPQLPLSKPIDLKFGPDGALYVLEYGNDYFLDNPDARLVRIEYAAGNRPPTARILAAARAGAVPFTTRFDAAQSSDPDPGDSLRFVWSVGGEVIGTDTSVTHTFREAGLHSVQLVVTDQWGKTAETSLAVRVGNEPPAIELATTANRSFYFQDRFEWPYDFRVRDPEDQRNGGIDPGRARVRYSYVADPRLLADIRSGEAVLPGGSLRYIEGAQLIESSDCYTCHNVDTENVGPAYLAVAQRYTLQPATVTQLAEKIINGGNGVWGERLMSAHPQLSTTDAESMVRYILSLREEEQLPLRGRLSLAAGAEPGGGFVIAGQYRDRGAANAEPLTGESLTILRPPQLEAEYAADALHRAYVPRGGNYRAFRQVNFRPGGRLRMYGLDLSGIRELQLRTHARSDGAIALYLGDPAGPPVATQPVAAASEWGAWKIITFKLPSTNGPTDVHLQWLGEDGQVVDDMGHHRPADVGWLDRLAFVK
jgi:cytochrome c